MHILIYSLYFAETVSHYHETENSLSIEDILTITPIDYSKTLLSLHINEQSTVYYDIIRFIMRNYWVIKQV